MMIDSFIDKYNTWRRRQLLENFDTTTYAMVGFGNHSANNIYPSLAILRLKLRYIVTKSEESRAAVAQAFPEVEATTDYASVLQDHTVKAILISTSPKAHFSLVCQALRAGKTVFVEKPPCQTLDELLELMALEEEKGVRCFVGFQKLYAPTLQLLKKACVKQALLQGASYRYRYVTGAYPEGDALTDLFIHPLSVILHLFGAIEDIQVQHCGDQKKGETFFLQLSHSGGTIGQVEFSTAYSWGSPQEEMSLSTKAGVYVWKNLEALTLSAKSKQMMGIPLEKITGHMPALTTLQERHAFVPTLVNNQLYTQGFVPEFQAFSQYCQGKTTDFPSTLQFTKQVFNLILQLKNKQNNV